MNLVCDPRSVHQACALDVFTKGHCSTSSVPKNLRAKVFNNHFLSVAQSTQNHERLYTCVPIGHVISANKNYRCYVIYANKNYQARPICHPILSVSELGKYISKLEFIYLFINRPVWNGISNQLLKLSPPYIIDSFAPIFNLCNTKHSFHLSLKSQSGSASKIYG